MTYEYKGKPYRILFEQKIKMDGVWHEIITYQCLYYNPDGQVWSRFKPEFLELFKPTNRKIMTCICEIIDENGQKFLSVTPELSNGNDTMMVPITNEKAEKLQKTFDDPQYED